MQDLPRAVVRCFALMILLGCSGREDESISTAGPGGNPSRATMGEAVFVADDEVLIRRPPPNPERLAFFGDLHVHTVYSFDAYAFGTLSTPHDAYRFARGEAI